MYAITKQTRYADGNHDAASFIEDEEPFDFEKDAIDIMAEIASSEILLGRKTTFTRLDKHTLDVSRREFNGDPTAVWTRYQLVIMATVR